jgi:hypothetical protein
MFVIHASGFMVEMARSVTHILMMPCSNRHIFLVRERQQLIQLTERLVCARFLEPSRDLVDRAFWASRPLACR